MIDLYASSSPNVQKIQIMLEETGLEYRLKPVNVHQGEQYGPKFSVLNPNQKVPVIVDQDGPGGRPYTVFESGAILLYLAEKSGQFLPVETAAHYDAIQWLMIQMAGVGPMLGQYNHFRRFDMTGSYGVTRYESEGRRLYDLLDARLGASPFLGGDSYSVADIATFPWIRVEERLFGKEVPGLRVDWEGHPNITRWFRGIEARPAVQRALTSIDSRPSTLSTASPKQLDRYFGRGEFTRSLS